MIANFEAPVGTEDKVEIEIEFDEPRGMLPLRVTAKYDHKLKFLNTPPYESRFRWKRHKKHGYLPDRIQFATHVGHQGGGVISEEYAVLCHWLVGDELTDELLDATIKGAHDNNLNAEVVKLLGQVQVDQTDHLSPLLDHFKIPHSVLIGTDRVGGQHTTPEGLYD